MTSVLLTEPFVVGPRTAPNRVVFGPHETNLGRDRSLSDRHLAYYTRRAAGGAGIVVTEEASVHPSDWPYERAPLATDCGPGWGEIVTAVHEFGALVVASLGHSGGQGTSHWSQLPLWAPSRVPEVNTREVPKWMEGNDIEAVIEGFGEAARLAAVAGCDGVEVNAGQFSLVRQFLSGLTNQRDDEWGQDRALFARRVLTAVRAAVGDDRIVSLRLCCDELAPWAGITPEAAVDLATAFASDTGAARIDLLTVVRGSIYSVGATRPDGHTPAGFNLDLCRSIRTAVTEATRGRVPVVAQGSIVDVGQARWALDDGVADAVEMTRAQIADADLVTKLRAGQSERIRPCVLCNQMCQVRDNRNPLVSCIGDPFAGHETEDVPVSGAALRPLDVTVVGGGVAGLEAARAAACRGHRVTLTERSPTFGGAVRMAAGGLGRERLSLLADWLEAECRALGVTLEPNREIGVADLEGSAHVLLATGARAGERTFAATRAAVVLTAAEALDDVDGLPDGAVLVWDPIGGPIGVSVAEVLAANGRQVHIATPDYIIGNELARSGDLAPANARLAQAGVTMHRRSILTAVKKSVAVLTDRFTGEARELRVDAVIDAGHRLPNTTLAERLVAEGHPDPIRIGDCVAPRTIHEAVLEGRRAALELG